MKRMFSLLFLILKALCYCPLGWLVNRGRMQSPGIVAFGTVQIMVGLFNILTSDGTNTYGLISLGAAPWLGTLYIAVGTASVFAHSCTSRCLVSFAVFMNMVGSAFAILGFWLHLLDHRDGSFFPMCDFESFNRDSCRFVAALASSLLRTLIILALLQLSVSFTLSVLALRALSTWEEGDAEVERSQPVEKELLLPKIAG
uniref:Uncharacterized protein n=1 Tax=Stegastes partitus TaxID=144197 RepID=A0A3B5AQ69_9TELE